MELFDFVKDVGQKLFDRDDEAADRIKKHVETHNPGVKDVGVRFKDGVVDLSGEAADQAAREKFVLMAGNVKGVKEVKADGVKAPAQGGKAEKVEYYTIRQGDTLSKIAKQYYGDAQDYPQIFDANREVIEDPDKIFVGQKIRIPLH
ncbi:MAG: peptidoglycan-binding protein LysM [Gammaproteobacteria bacterium]